MRASGSTRLILLAGDPIGHTRGYAEYAAALAERGADAAYLPAEVPAGQFAAFLAGVRWMRNLAGVVATVPHKVAAFASGTPDAAARDAGAANVLRPAEGGWTCTQTDGAGFVRACAAAGIGLAGRQVQVVGAGGAGRAVAMAVAALGPAAMAIHDLDGARAEALAAALRDRQPGLAAAAGLGRSEVLINCSTVGMGADERLAVPAALIPSGGAVYDVVNRADTPLLREAARRGCRTDHGRSMMLAQIPLVLDYLLG